MVTGGDDTATKDLSTQRGRSSLAFDLGASSGRAVVGQFDGERLRISDTHRFPNDPVRAHGHMYWDILRLLHEIKQGLIKTRLQGYADIGSIGIDTWGVDFGLIGRHGELLGNPYHYRDQHTQGIMEEVDRMVTREELFSRTGIQFLPFNTIYQLYALKKAASPLLEQAETLLLIPELIRYYLTGERRSEWTIASTTGLCNPRTRSWDRTLIERLGLPQKIFQEPVEPGTAVGRLQTGVCEELGIDALPVIAVAEHDTGSAVVAVPTADSDFAYLSSGTWSLIGTEIAEPVMNAQALAANVTNEGGIQGTTRLLKNVTGLWLIQECRRVWKNEGKELSYADEVELVNQTDGFRAFIDPDDAMFVSPAHMPRQIQHYCHETGQQIPETEGAILRCVMESLAMRYRFVLERLETLIGKHFNGLHIVGGGSQHTLLCQYTADALARPVWAGPQEATAIGNLLVQQITTGHIANIQQARQVVRNSFAIKTYEPVEARAWEEAYGTFCRVARQG